MTFPDFTRRLVFRSAFLSFFLLAVLAAIGGKSVKMISSWFNPNYEGQRFHKILVIGVAQNLEVRADFEDEMAAQIARPGIETIPGNHILLRPDPDVKLDLDYLRGQIRDNRIDAVVVSRLLKVDKKLTSMPSSTYIAPYPYYYSFYGYVGAVYPCFTIGDTRGKIRQLASRQTFTQQASQTVTWCGTASVTRSIRSRRRRSPMALSKRFRSRWRKTGCYRKRSPRTNDRTSFWLFKAQFFHFAVSEKRLSS